jgi:hypothetical protein
MQLSLEKRLSHGFTILANYTWSHSNDSLPFGADVTSPILNAGFVMPPTFPNFKSLDTGPSDFDFRQVFVVSYVWQLPSLSKMNRLVREVAGGWEISGITSAQTGIPLTILAGVDRSQTGIGMDHGQLVNQNTYTSGACAGQAPCVNFLVPSAFALPALGTFGNLAKGSLRGPGLLNFDMGIFKTFPITERWSFQFRAEFFNAFNRANFNAPGTTVSAGGFGSILSARDPRIGQLALKVFF